MTENKFFEYKIVPIGSHCFSRRILTEHSLKPSKSEGEKSMPFDLTFVPLESVIKILENNFVDYFDDLFYNEETYFWENKKYNMVYNHDKDCEYTDKEKLIERYKNRIKNFQDILKNDKFLYFTLVDTKAIDRETVEKIYNILSEKRNNKTNSFKLIVFDFFNSKLQNKNNIEIISIPHPYSNYAKQWWNQRYRLLEKNYDFENKVCNAMSEIISKQFVVQKYNGKEEDFAKKQIFINFADFPKPFMNSRRFSPYSNFITDILNKHYKVIISDEPDFLFYSLFGNTYEKYKNCVRIFHTCEVIVPNFNECDYAIGYDRITFGDRYIRHPFIFDDIKLEHLDRSHITDDYAKRKFCNFIYSNKNNGEGAEIRKIFCKKLAEYKHVDCPGGVLNNMKGAIGPRLGNFKAAKMSFQKQYKFTIAFENAMSLDYTTEKLTHAFMSDTIPIYWGNPNVVNDFNPKSFINCNDYNSFEEVIEKVKELDNDDDAYLKMLREPCLTSHDMFKEAENLERFLINIIEKGNKPYNKNPNPAINKYGYVDLKPAVKTK